MFDWYWKSHGDSEIAAGRLLAAVLLHVRAADGADGMFCGGLPGEPAGRPVTTRGAELGYPKMLFAARASCGRSATARAAAAQAVLLPGPER